jgi:hypothetical protein
MLQSDSRPAPSLLSAGLGTQGQPVTPCMPCSFGLLQCARSGADAQATDPVGVTVEDRRVPLVTAACGTQVARLARMTTFHLAATAPARPEGEARPR